MGTESLDQAKSQMGNLLENAELIFAACANEGREPSVEELALLRLAGHDDDRSIRRGIGRLTLAAKLRVTAGNAEQREALRAEAAKAREEASRKSAELGQEIKRLQREIDAAQATATRLETQSRDADAAAEELRNCCPPWVRETFDHRVREIKGGLGKRINQLKVEAAEYRLVLDHPATDRWTLEYCHRLPEGHPAKAQTLAAPRYQDGTGNTVVVRKWVDEPAWLAYQDECRSKLADVKAQLAELEPELDQALVEAKELLSYYVA